MTVTISGTSGIVNDATDLNYTGTLTGGTGVVNLGSGQVYKDASGNVGVGLTNPHAVVGAKVGTFGANSNTAGCSFGVDSSGATQPIMGLRWTGANAGIAGSNFTAQLVSDSANALFTEIYTTGATPLVFGTSSTERARIDSSGNLLVGTTTKNADGRVSISADGATHQGITIKDLSGANNVAYILFTNSLGNTAGLIVHSGSTTVSYTTSSDYRMKENIAPMTGALTAVSQLKPCTYTWKEDGKAGQGFIAHELQEVVPDCVYGEKDAVDADGNPQYQGIDTSFLVATLAAAIQELKAIVDGQSILIAAQAARITALEGAAA